MDAAMDHIEKKKKKKKIRGNMSDKRIKEENGVVEVFGTQESSSHGHVGGEKKETKKNKDLNTDNRSGKELKEENSLGRFIDVWGTQNSGSHESLERGEKKKKKKKNEDLMAENGLAKESEDSESHEKAQRQERRRKKKNRDLKSECFDGSEFDRSFVAKEEKRSTEEMPEKSRDFLEEVIEEKPVKNDSFNNGLGKERNSEKAKKKKKHRVVEVEREEKMNHVMEGDVKVEFEETPERSMIADGPAGFEESPGKSRKEEDKKRRRKRANGGEEIEAELEEKMSNKFSTEEKMAEEEGSKHVNTEGENPEGSAKTKSKEKMKKKRKERETIPDDAVDREDVSPSAKKQKKVTFSNQVEVCGADERNDKETFVDSKNAAGIPDTSNGEDNLIWGKRFTLEEDQKILDAIDKYIQEYGLDKDEGFNMILNCQKYSKVRNCWKEIASALPWRPLLSVYDRAHILCERSEERHWTKDEEDMLKRLQAEHGKKWNKIAKVLGKSRYHVKDKWRRMRRGVMNKGHMSQEEYQKLFNLVNYNLRLKLSGKEQKHTRNKIRKNINWEAIADKMETRDHVFCCKKWYGSLTSPMVESGQWQDGDDFILLKRLLESNASDEEVVDWDDLLKDRPGDICHKRWKQMVKQLGEHRSKSFLEKLELLVGRYAPELIE